MIEFAFAASRLLVVLAALTLTSAAASEQDVLKSSAETAPEALKLCGDCHMNYPAPMLPQRSWRALIGSLKDHFGSVATLPATDTTAILEFLTAHAADSPGATARDKHFLGALANDAVPLRITETPWWNQMHADFDFEGIKHSPVKSAANCLGCHPAGVN